MTLNKSEDIPTYHYKPEYIVNDGGAGENNPKTTFVRATEVEIGHQRVEFGRETTSHVVSTLQTIEHMFNNTFVYDQDQIKISQLHHRTLRFVRKPVGGLDALCDVEEYLAKETAIYRIVKHQAYYVHK
ncbi:hypothetical protein MBLNU459_g7252t1 [Dothideomycetes sp. NU459]